ncbi:hypothetical protein Q4E40_00960 [Pontibacter sp. BT731]|uniref:hypothetical protein n=1 Tax=Pontibacter coccineus TaxID=3063328 RepID=UPI0026E1A1C0|nr:hypothetical protein [Pontibacter sp. BT731]MDO6388674.1 hypothetical protein [Pontibacter sp. BT731]
MRERGEEPGIVSSAYANRKNKKKNQLRSRRMIRKTYLKTKDQGEVKFTMGLADGERVEKRMLNGD